MAWMDAVHRLYPKGNLSHCGKRKLELKYFSFVDITKECVLNYKYNNCNLGQFCYLASSGQVSFAFPMKSWHLMSENSQKMSVNYSEKNIASTKADNRNFKTITWNNLSSQPIQALVMCSVLAHTPIDFSGSSERIENRRYRPYFLLWQNLRCDLWGLITDAQIQNLIHQVTKAEQSTSAVSVTEIFQTTLGCE